MDNHTNDSCTFLPVGYPGPPCFLSVCGQNTFHVTFGSPPGSLELVHAESRAPKIYTAGNMESASMGTGRISIDPECGRIELFSGGVPVCTVEPPVLTEQAESIWAWQGGAPVYEPVSASESPWDCFPHICITNLTERSAPSDFSADLCLHISPSAPLHGLGQHEKGIFDYRNTHQYLYHTLMKTPMPFLSFGQGCGVLIDCGCLLEFQSTDGMISFHLDGINRLELFFLLTDSMDALVREVRLLTGRASMLPRWALGYLFSKERFHTQQELLETARIFRQKSIPCDCLVQDWRSWVEPLWGNKHFDPARFPTMKEAVNTLHAQNFRYMVAVWPNAFVGADDHRAMDRAGYLLGDYLTYDAFSEEARDLYYSQCEEYESVGADAFWADATEPFQEFEPSTETLLDDKTRSDAIGGAHKRLLGAQHANLYSLYHCRGLWEHWSRHHPNRRPVFLTRSVYPSEQQYGVIHWSGDISATWTAYRNQLAELLNMSICGIPYVAEDIGGFAVRRKEPPVWAWAGDYPGGMEDLGYRELYVRWMQNGALLPIFRSHGTDTPREPWFCADTPKIPFFQALLKAIHLRYRLLPYLYTVMADTVQVHDSMMRALCFDYPNDAKAASMSTQYLLGHSLMVCPVLEAFYYGPDSQKLDRNPEWPCYLPAGDDFYDWYTNAFYPGGQTVQVPAPIDRIPLFVKAGAILILSAHAMQSTAELSYEILDVRIYAGRSGTCSLYQDEGDGSGWEQGAFCRTEFIWDDSSRQLKIGARQGCYPNMPERQQLRLRLREPNGSLWEKNAFYEGVPLTIHW